MTERKVSTFRERFTELVSSSPKPQASIASEFGVSKQTISAWITGQNSPRIPVVVALADYFDVSFEWLMGFDVPRSVSTKEQSSLPDDEKHLLRLYRNADDRARKDAIRTLEEHQIRKDDPDAR